MFSNVRILFRIFLRLQCRFSDESTNLELLPSSTLELICYLISELSSVSFAFFKSKIIGQRRCNQPPSAGAEALGKMSAHNGEIGLFKNRKSRSLLTSSVLTVPGPWQMLNNMC